MKVVSEGLVQGTNDFERKCFSSIDQLLFAIKACFMNWSIFFVKKSIPQYTVGGFSSRPLPFGRAASLFLFSVVFFLGASRLVLFWASRMVSFSPWDASVGHVGKVVCLNLPRHWSSVQKGSSLRQQKRMHSAMFPWRLRLNDFSHSWLIRIRPLETLPNFLKAPAVPKRNNLW